MTPWAAGESLARAVLFMVLNLTVLYSATLASWRLLPDAPRAARLAAAGTTAVGLIVVLVQALGMARVYTWPAALLAALAVAALSHWRWARGARVIDDLRVPLDGIASLSPGGRLLGVVAVGAWFLAAWRAVSTLTRGWDSLTYHLPFAATFVQTANLSVPDGPMAMDHYAHFPKNAEMLLSWFMLPFHAGLLASLANTCLLLLAWVALYALARALDCLEGDSALAATAATASPFLYAFASSGDADPFVFTLLVVAVLFLVRWLQSGAVVDVGLALVAAALAAGAKYTALPLAVVIAVSVAVTAARRAWRTEGAGRAARSVALALVLMLACGGRQYIVNLVTTGNPVYPLTVSAGGSEWLTPSPYTGWLMSELGTGTRGDDRFSFSGMFHYYPSWKAPTSAGPKYLLLIPLALLAALLRRGSNVARLRLVVGFALLMLIAAQLPTTGLPALSRRFWPVSAARLVGVCFGLFAVGAAALPARLRPWLAAGVRAATAAFIVWDIVEAGRLMHPTPALELIFAGAALGVLCAPRFARWSRRSLAAAACALAVVVTVLVIPALDLRRAHLTWNDAPSMFVPDDGPNDYVRGWASLENAEPLRVALAVSHVNRGQGRFIYPLLGRRLQHTVQYVPVNPQAAPGSAAFVLEDDPREEDWVRELARQRIDRVVVQAPWPVEDEWMRRRNGAFVRVLDDQRIRIYRVAR